jgi:hypothetical protein
LNRPLGPTGGTAPVARDSAFAAIMLREKGAVMLPEVSASERTTWEMRSEWTLQADSLTLQVFTGLQGWRATVRPSAEGWSGRAQYLSDVVVKGMAPTFVVVDMRRIECPESWRALAPSPLRVSPSLAIYFAQQVEQEATLASTSPLPAGAARIVRAGVRARYVMAQFVIDSSGRALPDRVKILKTDSDSLSTRVLASVSALRFTPAVVKGQPVAQLVQWQFVFPLNER